MRVDAAFEVREVQAVAVQNLAYAWLHQAHTQARHDRGHRHAEAFVDVLQLGEVRRLARPRDVGDGREQHVLQDGPQDHVGAQRLWRLARERREVADPVRRSSADRARGRAGVRVARGVGVQREAFVAAQPEQVERAGLDLRVVARLH